MPVGKRRRPVRSSARKVRKARTASVRRPPTLVPDLVRQYLDVLTLVTGQPAAKILQDAIEAFIKALDPERRALVMKMVKSEAAAAAAGPVERPLNRPILCVDDNEAMLFARVTVLRREGFEVVEANSGRAALKLLETVKPALVLVDVNLPDMSGLDVTRQIKSDPRLSGVKVIQISATFGSPRDQLHGLEIGGADVYIAEPVQQDTLISVVKRLLGI
jgi:CheY-like chemotaxis protein